MRLLMVELQREDICARIQQARLEAGLKQHEMAELLEAHPRSIQNYESDRVPWDKLGQIAEITGKSKVWLLHGGEAQEPASNGIASLEREVMEVKRKLDELLAATDPLATQPDEESKVLPLDGVLRRGTPGASPDGKAPGRSPNQGQGKRRKRA